MPDWEKKKDEETKNNGFEVEIEDDTDIEEDKEETVIINEDDLNIFIKEEDVVDLVENEAMIVAQKVEIEIEKYENMLIEAENQNFTEQELFNLGFVPEEYARLKSLEKKIYKHIRKIRYDKKGKGFFASLPIWAAILGIICALFNIIPVNPYLPLIICDALYSVFTSPFMQGKGGACVIYACYMVFFWAIQLTILFILLHKARKNREKMPTFKSFLIVVIFNFIVAIPAIVIFISAIVKM